MGHNNHKEHTGQAWAFLLIGVGALLVTVYGFGSAIQDSAKQLLDLNPEDIFMIPVGGAVFVAFWLIMEKALFSPITKVVEERESLTQGAEVSAAEAKQQTAQLEAEYEEKLTGARVEGMQIKAKVLGEAREKAQAVVDAASDASLKEIANARQVIASEGEALKKQLLSDSDDLVNAVVEKVTSSPEPVKSVRS